MYFDGFTSIDIDEGRKEANFASKKFKKDGATFQKQLNIFLISLSTLREKSIAAFAYRTIS